MCYALYLNNLKKCTKEVNMAVRGGVILTRLENFDYLFKKELAIAEGIRAKRNFLYKLVNNVTEFDYRLACYYAQSFKDVMDTVENGYSVKGVTKQFKCFIKNAKSKYICTKNINVGIKDINGKITVTVFEGKVEKYTFVINDIEDYVKASLYLVSLLGSLEEVSEGYRVWFSEYLAKEYKKIVNDYIPEPYIEKERITKDLRSFVMKENKEKCISLEEGKLIHLNNHKCM